MMRERAPSALRLLAVRVSPELNFNGNKPIRGCGEFRTKVSKNVPGRHD